ncbi:MAG: hypothetical protein ACLSAP_10955 [Oscillospiraceae bacterium]
MTAPQPAGVIRASCGGPNARAKTRRITPVKPDCTADIANGSMSSRCFALNTSVQASAAGLAA